jgi:prepilin-type N-terminal cleavage/methylation domain-containing protein
MYLKYFKKTNKSIQSRLTKGFTLIELLIVVSIVSVLSTVVFASVNRARQQAFDTKAKVLMRDVANVLLADKAVFSAGSEAPAECTTVFSSPTLTRIFQDIADISKSPVSSLRCSKVINSYSFAITAPSRTADKTYCTDDTRVAAAITSGSVTDVLNYVTCSVGTPYVEASLFASLIGGGSGSGSGTSAPVPAAAVGLFGGKQITVAFNKSLSNPTLGDTPFLIEASSVNILSSNLNTLVLYAPAGYTCGSSVLDYDKTRGVSALRDAEGNEVDNFTMVINCQN